MISTELVRYVRGSLSIILKTLFSIHHFQYPLNVNSTDTISMIWLPFLSFLLVFNISVNGQIQSLFEYRNGPCTVRPPACVLNWFELQTNSKLEI